MSNISNEIKQPDHSEKKERRQYDPRRAYDSDSKQDLLKDNGSAKSLAFGVKYFFNEQEIAELQGPTLSLYAGMAGGEKEFLSLLPISNQKIIAIDYNPNLKANDDEQTTYLIGDVIDKLSELEPNSFGIITIFSADGSMSKEDWEIIQKEAHRVLKDNGYIFIYPNVTVKVIPNGFKFIDCGPLQCLACLKKI